VPTTAPAIHALDWRLSPHELLARWRRDRRLVALISSDSASRWSIFATPTKTIHIHDTVDPLAALDRAVAFPQMDAASPLPFLSGWIVAHSYDLGRAIEPAAQHRAADHLRTGNHAPLIELHRCDSALIHDALDNTWHAIGEPPPLDPARDVAPADFLAGIPVSLSGRSRYTDAVARCIDLIREGHIFQANIAHQLAGTFSGSPRTFMQRLLASAAPGYAAYLESDGRTICSISPELFLDVDFNTRRVTTRPIKGTRPATDADRADLERSEKDRAELAMIVDLMRNDLGRVCEYASVHVDHPRAIDRIGPPGATRHAPAAWCSASDPCTGALYHASSTISGKLRPDITLADLLRATFPPGSVTGAPKVRAMQIIDELEPHRRGMYCGTLGFISDHGRASFNVAIRTATLDHTTGALTFPVGAGIVADSDPESEWNETMHKAQMFLNSLNPSPAPRETKGQRASAGQVRASEIAR